MRGGGCGVGRAAASVVHGQRRDGGGARLPRAGGGAARAHGDVGPAPGAVCSGAGGGGGVISDGEVVLRLLLASLLSGLVGLEREAKGRAAGLRTHVLVCMGSTLIMLTGVYMAAQYRGVLEVDPTRMAAQVISGIGFLGAGTIIQFRDSVRGLTTAASVWAAGGIGVAVGTGFYLGAAAATVIVLVVLHVLHDFESRLSAKMKQP
ncbi:MAG: MgtC/SapB family protein [Candidatus Omnitrophica bacterium]|nr:MgtC/SapB family protein [Candidatus Omnitrophota bacterium]